MTVNKLRTSALAAFVAFAAAAAAHAQSIEVFKNADLALGQRLIVQGKCTECHASQVGGDGSAIYRPAGRINTPARLLAMVERCGTQLNLGLFPDDVVAIAAVLQRDHYRFK